MSCLKQLYVHYILSLLRSTRSYLGKMPLRCLLVTSELMEMDKTHTARQDWVDFKRKIRMVERESNTVMK